MDGGGGGGKQRSHDKEKSYPASYFSSLEGKGGRNAGCFLAAGVERNGEASSRVISASLLVDLNLILAAATSS